MHAFVAMGAGRERKVQIVMTSAQLKDGTRVGARGGVYMRPVVEVRHEDQIFVRAQRWVRYWVRDDGQVKMTGRGVASVPPSAEVRL